MEFSGPSWNNLLESTVGAGVVGGIYTELSQTNGLAVPILIMRELVDCVFYNLATLYATEAETKAKVYAFTNITVNLATLWIMRRARLIANIGTAVFAALMAVELACKWVDFAKYRPPEELIEYE